MLFLLCGMMSSAEAASVLILWDDSATNVNTVALKNYLVAKGHSVTMSTTSETSYDGTNPAPTAFGAVIHLNGTTFASGMPSAGQTALLSYVQNGGGFIDSEWNAYEISANAASNTALRELSLMDRTTGDSGSTTITVVNSVHPVMAGLPSSFLITGGFNVGPMHTFSSWAAATLATDSAGSAAVAAREYMKGRVVSFHHAGNWGSSTLLSDANVELLYANAVSWVSGCKDSDGDGYTASSCGGTDCDDTNKSINPAAQEVCDTSNVDEDCDGLADDKDSSATGQTTWYLDSDADGYGGTTSAKYCDQASGYVATSTDCNDSNKLINPAAQEVCDSSNTDEDCDGNADDKDSSATGQSTWYVDSDADGYGGSSSVKYCDQPSGYVATSTDCNDSNKLINPAAQEVCDSNNTDEDCDGNADDKDSSTTGQTAWYKDGDSDGYGGSTKLLLCDQSSGYVTTTADCDDTNKAVSPAATELCNNIDDNCDGQIDESSAANASTWYADSDGDTYGNAAVTLVRCSLPTGYVSNASDCNDAAATIYPGAAEYCNGSDDNCDGVTDESTAVDVITWNLDDDGDGFGDASDVMLACDQPADYVEDDQDCDDGNGSVYPGAEEVCNNIDDNCDGQTDESSATDAATWYQDADGDQYGNPAVALIQCVQPTGYVAIATDCDDGASAVSPAGIEFCNTIDDNCDGVVDESTAVDASTWYADGDGDGYGDAKSPIQSCGPVMGAVADATDCADWDATAYPGATEFCNGADDNCDGVVDEVTAADVTTWYTDGDGDGYGDTAQSVVQCDQPIGTVTMAGDCNDGDAAYNPGATESCLDPQDYNCDGSVGYADQDGDGFAACEECDDLDGNINPSAVETCNNLDDNCDGKTDDASAVGQPTFYGDADGDGFGVGSDTVVACTEPGGYASQEGDCEDNEPKINPGAEEVCNGRDDNCDGLTDDESATDPSDYYADQDGDGYGDPLNTVTACDAPEGYVRTGSDCDDTNPDYNPGALEDDCEDPEDYNCDGSVGYEDADLDGVAACVDCDDGDAAALPGGTEVCDGSDNDCNGTVDDDVTDATVWYADLDEDGFGDEQNTVEGCDAPDGFVGDPNDCDDDAGGVNPDAVESCNEIDDNCNSQVDEGCDVKPSDGCGCAATTPTEGAGFFGMLFAGLMARLRRRK